MNARPAALVAWAVVGVLVLAPLVALLGAAIDPPPDAFGVRLGLAQLLAQAGLGALVLRSLALALGVMALVLPAGVWLAWVEHRVELPLRRVLLLATLLPLGMPSYVLASTVARALEPGGWLPLEHALGGLPAATFVIALVTVPYVQLVVGSALASGSAAEEEAARALGAPPLRVFVDVVWPRIRGAVGYAGLLAMLYALSDFGAVAVLDAPVLTWRLYQAVVDQQIARAALLGGALLLATLPLFAASRAIQGADRGAGVANPRQPARVPATAGSAALTYLVAAVVIGAGVALPVATMGAWVWEGLERGLPFAPLGQPVVDTLLLTAWGTALTLLLALAPAAAVGLRRRSGALDLVTYLTSSLPGVLLAFGWVLAGLALARWTGVRGLYAGLLGSGALLSLGYATRYLAEAYTPLKTSLWRVDPRLFEAHRALAGRWPQLVVGVLLPAAGPGIAAAALLAALAVVKELPITLLLGSGTGYRTLAFRVWDRSSEALWHDAGAAGLSLVGLSLVAVLLSLPWRRHA